MLVWAILLLVAFLVLAAIYDLTQRKHAILRNFPLIGHFPLLVGERRPGVAPIHRHLQ